MLTEVGPRDLCLLDLPLIRSVTLRAHSDFVEDFVGFIGNAIILLELLFVDNIFEFSHQGLIVVLDQFVDDSRLVFGMSNFKRRH